MRRGSRRRRHRRVPLARLGRDRGRRSGRATLGVPIVRELKDEDTIGDLDEALRHERERARLRGEANLGALVVRLGNSDAILAHAMDEEAFGGNVKVDAGMGAGELVGDAEADVDAMLGGLEGVSEGGGVIGASQDEGGAANELLEGDVAVGEEDLALELVEGFGPWLWLWGPTCGVGDHLGLRSEKNGDGGRQEAREGLGGWGGRMFRARWEAGNRL